MKMAVFRVLPLLAEETFAGERTSEACNRINVMGQDFLGWTPRNLTITNISA